MLTGIKRGILICIYSFINIEIDCILQIESHLSEELGDQVTGRPADFAESGCCTLGTLISFLVILCL